MELSMWMIANRLKSYAPDADIKDGSAHITGVRFASEQGASVPLSQYVYVRADNGAVLLVNGEDIISFAAIESQSGFFNDLMEVFDFYNAWESELKRLATQKAFQEMLDRSLDVLRNPMILSDMDGNVLAMSSAFRDEDINEYWVESRETGHIPTAILGSPVQTLDGTYSSWTDTPEIYILPDETRTIGVYLNVDGTQAAGLGLWECKDLIRPGDLQLSEVLCGALRSAYDAERADAPARDQAEIVADLLGGIQINSDLVDRFSLALSARCVGPWRLLVIESPYRTDATYRRNLLHRLQMSNIPCLSLLFGDRVVALVTADLALPLLDVILTAKDKKYYVTGISLPFSTLHGIRARYLQTVFAFDRAGGTPGVYLGEDHALPYLLGLIGGQNKAQDLTHPALNTLKQYDSENHAEFYETLYQYLIHERSVLRGAEALHIHKNSFLYRMRRIRDLTCIDLDDADQRNYLLLSYLMDKAQ